MSVRSFDFVLSQLAARNRPRQSHDWLGTPGIVFSLQCASNLQQHVSPNELQDASKRDLSAYFSSRYDGDLTREEENVIPRHGLPELFNAWRVVVHEIQSAPHKSTADLLQLRADYARLFHPDKLPSELSSIANEKMADVNARIDAALSHT